MVPWLAPVLSSGGVPGFGARCSLPVVVGSANSVSVVGVAVEIDVCVAVDVLPICIGGTAVTIPWNVSSLTMMLISCTAGAAGRG